MDKIINVENDHGIRIDQFLTQYLGGTSRSRVQSLIGREKVCVNAKIVKKHYLLRPGDRIELGEMESAAPSHLLPVSMPLDILYEDKFLIAVNKPPFLSVHPGAGPPVPTLVHGLLAYTENLASNGCRPGIVHRLDKETSGILLIAKDDTTLHMLSSAFQNRKVHKTYLAVTHSTPPEGTFTHLLTRDPKCRTRYTVSTSEGKEAISTFIVLCKTGSVSLVQIEPATGRTHQIRVQLSHLKAPVYGDKLYSKMKVPPRHMLHATRLNLIHPITQMPLELSAPIPADFAAVLKRENLR